MTWRRSCGWFNHQFKKYGKPVDGHQEMKCRRCGRLKTVKANCWGFHSYKKFGNKRKGGIQVRCVKCNRVKSITRKV